MSCQNKRTYISTPTPPGFSQVRALPSDPTDWTGLQRFLKSVKDVLEGTTPNNPVIPYAITNFIATVCPSGIRLTWDHDKNSAFYVIHRNDNNNYDQSRIVCAMYADHGKPSFYDVGGQQTAGTQRFYWIRGYGPTGAPGPLVGPLISYDPGIGNGFDSLMYGPKTGTLITMADGSTTAVEDLQVGDDLWPIDPVHPIFITEAPTPIEIDCIQFTTQYGKILTIPTTQLVHEYEGGMIPAQALVVGNEIRTIDGNEVIIARDHVGMTVVWRVRLNEKMWYPAERYWIWGMEGVGIDNSGDAQQDTGYIGDIPFMVVTRPQQSSSSQEMVFNSSQTRFNPNWYLPAENVEFLIEFVAYNADSVDRTITVEDTSGNVAYTYDVPTGMSGAKFFQNPFTPLSGERNYRLRLDQTTHLGDLKVYDLLFRIRCNGVTTMTLNYPFMHAYKPISAQDVRNGDDRISNNNTSGPTEESGAGYFYKEAGAWATVDHWSFETCAGNTGILGAFTMSVKLCKTDGTLVEEHEHLTDASTPDYQTTDIADNDANFDDGDEYTIFSQSSVVGPLYFNNASINKVSLYCFLTNVTKANIYWPIDDPAKTPFVVGGSVTGVYHEATARESVSGTLAADVVYSSSQYAAGANIGSVSGGSINPNSSSKTRYRTSALTLPGEYYYNTSRAGSGTVSWADGWLLAKVVAFSQPSNDQIYYRLQRDFESSDSSVELSFRKQNLGEPDSSEEETANLDSYGCFRALGGFGILNSNDGITITDDPRTWRSMRIQGGIITQVVDADTSSDALSVTVPRCITFIIDGGGAAITTGEKGDLEIPFACTLQAWTLLADQSGAIKIDVWKDVYGSYPPTDADSITNGHEPEIAASGTKAQDTTLGDWTTVTINAGDTLRFNVDSCTTITRVTLSFKVTSSAT